MYNNHALFTLLFSALDLGWWPPFPTLPHTTPLLPTPSLFPLTSFYTIPHYHFSSLPSPLLTPLPLTPLLFITPLTTSPHYSPHYPSPPLLTTLLTTPLLTLLWLITYLPHHTPSPPSSPLTTTYHPLKGRHNTKRLVKSHFPMSLNLCRTFLSLKTSFLTIIYKK